jgi:hypothetical protein
MEEEEKDSFNPWNLFVGFNVHNSSKIFHTRANLICYSTLENASDHSLIPI